MKNIRKCISSKKLSWNKVSGDMPHQSSPTDAEQDSGAISRATYPLQLFLHEASLVHLDFLAKTL